MLYLFSVFASLGFLYGGRASNFFLSVEAYTRALTYVVFISAHVVRLSHAGMVCAGSYLEEGAEVTEGEYMISTGKWMTTYIIMAWLVVPATLFIFVCWKGNMFGKTALDTYK